MLKYLFYLLIILNCKKPIDKIENKMDKKDNNFLAVVVLSFGESRIIHSDLTEEKASIGVSFKYGDKIITGPKSKVDIQIGKNTSVRLASNSKIDFIQLNQNSTASNTKLQLSLGKIYAKVNKENKNDSFEITTPTLVAGVRGTSFVMEVKNNETVNIKVSDGSVSVSPRVPKFEKVSVTEIESNAGFKKLNSVLTDSEIILDKDQEIELSANNKILSNDSLEPSSVKNMITEINGIKKTKAIPADLTKNEQQEFKTIVSVDSKISSEMARLNDELSSGKVDEKKADSLEQKRAELEKQILSKQEILKSKFNEEIVVQPKKLQSKKEIIKYYERIEKIILADGRVEIGAIINQEDSIMVIHTENGIIRVNTNEIIEVVYDFQTKFKY